MDSSLFRSTALPRLSQYSAYTMQNCPPPVKIQPFLIGCFIVPVWKDPGPADAEPQAAKSHLRAQCDIFPIPVIEIHSLMTRIIQRLIDHRGEHSGFIRTAALHKVLDGQSLSSFFPRSFALIGGYCSAPQKIFRKYAHIPFSSSFFNLSME